MGPIEVVPRGYPTVAPATGSDVTQGVKVLNYALITDGTNDCLLQIYEGTTSGTLLWQDTCLGASKGKTFSFGPAALRVANLNNSICLHVTGTGAKALVQVGND